MTHVCAPGRQPDADKSALRSTYRRVRDGITDAARAEAEAAMRQALTRLPAYRRASLLCLYAPIGSEIDLLPLWRTASADGKRVAMPCTDQPERGRMVFRLLPDCDPALLTSGPFGTREPVSACPVVSDEDMSGALIVLPGLAFDERGQRLGYGRGYYDKYLGGLLRRGIYPDTAGLVFDACLTPKLPHNNTDIPVRCVLTERRILFTHADYTS